MKLKSFYLINALAVIAAFMVIITACKKEDDPPVFNLALSVNPFQSGTVEGAGNYQEGERVSLSATPNEGYEFVNWTDGQDAEVSTNASFQYTMPATDVTLTANFAEIEPEKYTLALEVDPLNSGTVEGAGNYQEGETVSLSATPNEGYEFVNWTDGQDTEVSTNASFQYTMPAEDATLTANFSEVKHTLILQVNPPDAGTVDGAGEYLGGETIYLSASANAGFGFVYWSDQQDALVSTESAFHYTMPGEDITLTANFVAQEIIAGEGVTDYDGNEYETLIIAGKEWMAKNLRTTRYNDGTLIPTGHYNHEWAGLTSGASAIQPHTNIDGIDSEEGVLDAYGALYNWYAVDTENLCPTGWRVPTDTEWTILINLLEGGSVAGGKLKSTRTDPDNHPRWDSPNTGATDESGFSSLPGGSRDNFDGNFYGLGRFGYWWSSTEGDQDYAWLRYMRYNDGYAHRDKFNKGEGFSVRCIKVD